MQAAYQIFYMASKIHIHVTPNTLLSIALDPKIYTGTCKCWWIQIKYPSNSVSKFIFGNQQFLLLCHSQKIRFLLLYQLASILDFEGMVVALSSEPYWTVKASNSCWLTNKRLHMSMMNQLYHTVLVILQSLDSKQRSLLTFHSQACLSSLRT